MKQFFFLLCFCTAPALFAHKGTLEQLKQVNAYWDVQGIPAEQLPEVAPQDDRAWIRTHLGLVEQVLRHKSMRHLSPAQQQQRRQSLDDLHTYMLAGQFPINDQYDFATPIFIDPYDNFCAVGYLIKASGEEALSRKIAARTNLAYVKDMDYPELLAWADEHGFSVDELAWIQPEYSPPLLFDEVAGGVIGRVNKLFADGDQRLYVGGNFSAAGGDTAINGIGYLTPATIENTYDWYKMGTGINGAVHTIVKWQDAIIAGGNFDQAGSVPVSNIARWNDEGEWSAMGCLEGTVKSLQVFDDQLYAAGEFTLCENTAAVNLARWDAAADTWVPLPGLRGHINVVEVADTALFIGGLFQYGVDSLNIIRWTPQGDFIPFVNGSRYEVNDINIQHGFAACSRNSMEDSVEYLYLRLVGELWEPGVNVGNTSPEWLNYPLQVYSMAETEIMFMAGGTPNDDGYATFWAGTDDAFQWNTFDSMVYDIIDFDGNTFVAGAFAGAADDHGNASYKGLGMYYYSTGLNEVNRNNQVKVYPNPVRGQQLFIETEGMAVQQAALSDVQGRNLAQWPLDRKQGRQELRLPVVSPGLYFLNFTDARGSQLVRKIMVTR